MTTATFQGPIYTEPPKHVIYCGARYTTFGKCKCGRCDGICGPNDGCQCEGCEIVEQKTRIFGPFNAACRDAAQHEIYALQQRAHSEAMREFQKKQEASLRQFEMRTKRIYEHHAKQKPIGEPVVVSPTYEGPPVEGSPQRKDRPSEAR